ncbi:MAG: DUF2461 domain-containing protein [Pyrinomonadaceae bacterium]
MKKTLDFLKKLKKNNNRDWFLANKKLYDAAREEFAFEVDSLIGGIARFDPEMLGTVAGDCMFRIYRDVRFSKDKSPYKTAFGAYMGPGGRKSSVPGYYLHVSPGESFIAGGAYQPAPEALMKIRNAIAEDTTGFRKILNAKKFRETFGDLEGEQLKTAPKGFPKDHPAIDLLKFKSFIVVRKFKSDKALTETSFAKDTLSGFRSLQPMLLFLREATRA